MISAWLTIKFWEYSVLLTIINLFIFLKSVELPSYKAVIIWIGTSSNERPSPITWNTKIEKILLTFWREKFQPMFRIFEWWNVFFLNSNLHKNFILGWWYFWNFRFLSISWLCLSFLSTFWNFGFLFFFLRLNFFLFDFWLFRSCFSCFNFSFESICCSLNRHSCAMESKGPYCILSSLPLIPYLKFSLRHWKGMSKMKIPIHIWIWECNHILLFILLINCFRGIIIRWILVNIFLWIWIPFFLHMLLNFSESIKSCSTCFLLFLHLCGLIIKFRSVSKYFTIQLNLSCF